jgi:putative membrane protein
MFGEGHWMGDGGFHMWLYWGGLTLFFLLLFYLAGRAFGKKSTADKTARQILDERYAKGELDHDEYEQMKSDLSHE